MFIQRGPYSLQNGLPKRHELRVYLPTSLETTTPLERGYLGQRASSIHTLIITVTRVYSPSVSPKKETAQQPKDIHTTATPVISPRSVCFLLYCVRCHKKKRDCDTGAIYFLHISDTGSNVASLSFAASEKWQTEGGVYLAGVYRTCIHGSLRCVAGWRRSYTPPYPLLLPTRDISI